jgi:hemerythrin
MGAFNMTKIEWDDSLSVGINLIDEQHKMLIQRIKDLSDAVESTRGLEKILQTLGFMIDYTDFHFSTEEKYMVQLGYPGFDIHKEQHEEFKSTLNHMVEDFEEDGATVALSTSINTFLINWLIKHIKSIDRKFGEFLQDKGFEES